MNRTELDTLVRSLDPVERIQVRTRENTADFDGGELAAEPDGIPRMQGKYFFGDGDVHIRKHHRFAAMPVHKHDFIELNYMYSGSCEQSIGGRSVSLREGDVCLLDRNVPHSIAPLGEDDILINILLRQETIAPLFRNEAPGDGAVESFLSHALSESRRPGRFIVFRAGTGENPKLHELILSMMLEAFAPDVHSAGLLRHYVPILFIELKRVYELDLNYDPEAPIRRGAIAEALAFMEEKNGNCTLAELADRFHFHPKYMGSLLKNQTGSTFTEWIQRHRLDRAARLLKETDVGVEEVARLSGYESLGFFYRKFKARFGRTPHEYRRDS